MGVNKFLKHEAGKVSEEQAATTGGTGQENCIISTGADGLIDSSLMPVGVAPDVVVAASGENLAAGDYVYISGTGTVLKADASDSTKGAIGFVLDAVTSPANATVFFEGTNNQLSGLTIGARYYLDHTTAGSVTNAAGLTTTATHISQYLGTAVSATTISTEINDCIILA